jgi:hypothetical protein
MTPTCRIQPRDGASLPRQLPSPLSQPPGAV